MWFCLPKCLTYTLFQSPGSPLPTFTNSKVVHLHHVRGESLRMRLHVHISKADNHRDFQRYYMYICTVHVHVQSVIGIRQYKATTCTSEDGSFFQRKKELPQAGLEPATSYIHTMQMLYQVSRRGSSGQMCTHLQVYMGTCVLVRCSASLG